MKLTKKLLTVLPLSAISAITPIVVSGCSCSSSYEIKYGDSINCKNKDDKNVKYHSIDEVKNASRDHVQVLAGEFITWEKALAKLRDSTSPSTEMMQHFYYDLVYSAAYEKVEYTLTWNVNKDNSELTFNGSTYTSLVYKQEGNECFFYGNGSTKLVKSYSYSQPK